MGCRGPALESGHGHRSPAAANADQLQLPQLDELQLPQPLDEPMELTDRPPLEKPNREMLLWIRLLPHFSHGGNGDLELATIVSKTWLHFLHSNS